LAPSHFEFAHAAAVYAKYGFLPFPSDPHHLAIALETVEQVFGA
jgi:hypothetical protein